MKGETRIAVVLFNLGGPDRPADVRPFLENLFGDRAIIGAPGLVRRPLAALIARRREKSAVANYAVMGGGSPLLDNTRMQAAALQTALEGRLSGARPRVFVAMRHWRPTSDRIAAEVAAFRPDQIVLTPLYPQFSTTTTASSLAAWRKVYAGPGESRAVCCWYDNPGFIEAHASLIRETWEAAGRPAVRLLFSAHGLPQSIAASGDPYQWQVEATCAAISNRLGSGWDWRICYQSRVGPMKWLRPSTPEAIQAAGVEGLGVLIDPVAFVSEHVETLVELDRDYALIARQANVPVYLRAPAVGVTQGFIEGVADVVERALSMPGTAPHGTACPTRFGQCGRRSAGEAP